MKNQRTVRCRSGVAGRGDGDQLDLVSAGGKRVRQISYMALLATSTRGVKLGEHQYAHRANNASAPRWSRPTRAPRCQCRSAGQAEGAVAADTIRLSREWSGTL